jgi:hypothetical protein
MALLRQIEDNEWDILSIVTDPILLGEFLRNTADGSPNKEEWPQMPFKYRWYQKDLLSDQNEFIALTAGRAVGKCSPLGARIYTAGIGYMSISDIIRQYNATGFYPVLYTMDENRQLTQRRMWLTKNGYADVFEVTTKQGHIFRGTANHPLLTERGWIMISDLDELDRCAITTSLPHASGKEELRWEELRWLGYVAGLRKINPEVDFPLRFQRSVAEVQRIAKYFDATFTRNANGTYKLLRKRGPLKHYMKKFFNEQHMLNAKSEGFIRIPPNIKAESNEQLKVFLEALFSNFAEFTASEIHIEHGFKTFIYDIQELLLRYGIESRVARVTEGMWGLDVHEYQSYYQFFETFDVPGISVKNLKMPPRRDDYTTWLRFDEIVSINLLGRQATFAITVQDTENYISDNLLVHNSLVLEDKIIYNAVNVDTEFPATKESLLVTPNVAQMTPILDRLIMRLSGSTLLKDFLRGNINKSKGTMDFPQPGGSNYRIHARIAGSTGETNMVGLHLPKMIGDEMQIFPMAAFTQLMPAWNSWEPRATQLFCGCPNGVREGNVLYMLDQRMAKFKKYRIPAHQNPFYTYQDDRENLARYVGEDSDDYQHLVLGRHGEAAFSIIPRDKIVTEPFEFYSHRYTQTDKHHGKDFRIQLGLHKIPDNKAHTRIMAIDTGYSDPTVIQIICRDSKGTWRTFVRYRLTRIPFPEQADIIDWLDNFYHCDMICVDLGAGGGGIGLTQDLQSSRFTKYKDYIKRIHGVRFADYLDHGENADGTPLKINAKSFAGQELARLITEGQFIFSEIDAEGLSQMERVAYQRRGDGTNQYFILSERGSGKSNDDHIFASYIVFVLTLLTALLQRPKKKLIKPGWIK